MQTVAFPLVDRKIIARYPISLPPRNLIREVNSEYSFFIFNALLKSVLTLFVYVGFFPDKKNRHIRTLNGAIDQFPGSRIPFFSRFVPDGFVEKYGFCRTLVFARVVNQSPISIGGISEGKYIRATTILLRARSAIRTKNKNDNCLNTGIVPKAIEIRVAAPWPR